MRNTDLYRDQDDYERFKMTTISKKEAAVLVERGLLKKEIYDTIPDDNPRPGQSLYEKAGRLAKPDSKHMLTEGAVAPDANEGAQRVNKYRNKKVYLYEDGVNSEDKNLQGHGKVSDVFDSKKEFDRWNQLQMLQRAGGISELDRQKTFILLEGYKIDGRTVYPVKYKADFYYRNNVTGKYVIEDVKPFDKKTKQYKTTKDFAIKRKLLEHKYCLSGECVFQLY